MFVYYPVMYRQYPSEVGIAGGKLLVLPIRHREICGSTAFLPHTVDGYALHSLSYKISQ